MLNAKADKQARAKRLATLLSWVGILLIGWLYLVPPTIQLTGGGDVIGCRPLGPGIAGEVSVIGSHTYVPSWETAEEYISEREQSSGSDSFRSEAVLLLDSGCEQARTNRQTSLFLVTAGTLFCALTATRLRPTPVSSAPDRPTIGDTQ